MPTVKLRLLYISDCFLRRLNFVGNMLKVKSRTGVVDIYRAAQATAASAVGEALAMAVANRTPRPKQLGSAEVEAEAVTAVEGPCLSRLVDESHQRFELVFCMLLGIRTLVSSPELIGLNKDPAQHGRAGPVPPGLALEAADFTQKRVFFFKPEGTPETPPHRYREFKFKDFAPDVFERLRGLAGISEEEYLSSLTHQLVLREVAGDGAKGGAAFFYSHDIKLVVKTITIEEKRQMVRAAP